MAILDSSYYDLPYGSGNEDEQAQQQRVAQQQADPYLSLLELITEVYQVEYVLPLICFYIFFLMSTIKLEVLLLFFLLIQSVFKHANIFFNVY